MNFMVKFGFDEYAVELDGWSKHHKRIGIMGKLVYEDGEVICTEDECLKRMMEKHESLLIEKPISLINRETWERTTATEYYFIVDNLEYQDAKVDYYSNGASNTSQKSSIRFTFLLDDLTFILDYVYTTSGSFATSLYQLLDFDGLETILSEVVEQKEFNDVGIGRGEDGRDYKEESYHIATVDPSGQARVVEVSANELLESLIGVELYDFDLEIIEDE